MVDLFASDAFKEKWSEWVEYRKDLKLKKYAMGGKYVQKRLLKLSAGDEVKAMAMIDQAMENNWQGFGFEEEKQLKKKQDGTQQAINNGSQQNGSNAAGAGKLAALGNW